MSLSSPCAFVSALNTFPLKSAKGIASSQILLDARGPAQDRRWMLVDQNNHFLTQRQIHEMCLIAVAVSAAGIELSAPDRLNIVVSEAEYTVQREVIVWDDRVVAVDCGDRVAGWLTDFLKVECRLVYMPDDVLRSVDANYPAASISAPAMVSFADGFPLLLVSEASLQDLNNRLSFPITMDRFRPNIVVSGCEAYAEDGWKLLRIGKLEFSVVKPCSRCVIPAIEPRTAIKDNEVLRALASYRRQEGVIYFGQNLMHHQGGVIKVGDSVEILG